jgi:hypothetical protein
MEFSACEGEGYGHGKRRKRKGILGGVLGYEEWTTRRHLPFLMEQYVDLRLK